MRHVDGEPTRGVLPAVCPACGATVRADVSWCTQCYAPLRPTEGDPEQRPEVPVPTRTADPANPADPAEVERLADQMLASLAAERDDLPGLASRLPTTPLARAALVTGVIAGGAALLVLLMFVLGSIL